jgi:hypothetical protein
LLANQLNEIWDLSSGLGSLAYCKAECDKEFLDFQLLIFKTLAAVPVVVHIWGNYKLFKNFIGRIEQSFVKNRLCEPKPFVFFQNVFVDRRRNLYLSVNRPWQPVLLKSSRALTQVKGLTLVFQSYGPIICKLVEPLLVNKFTSFVNQDVSIFCFSPALVLNNLLHRLVMSMLVQMRFKLGILPTKRLIGNVVRIESTDDVIIEFKPGVSVFPFLDQTVVMATVSGAQVNNDTGQFVLEVFRAGDFIKNHLPILVEIVNRQIVRLHFAYQILSLDMLLTVLLQIKLHWKLTVVIDFEFCHRVKIEFKPLQLEEEYVWEAFDRCPLERVAFDLAFFAEIGIVSF